VPEIGLGCWQLGGGWGNDWNDDVAQQTLQTAVDAGVRFIDTADVYGDGHSERLIARLRREHKGHDFYVATKAGRRLPQQTVDGYTRENLTAFIERSLKNLEVEAIDLLQVHCPPQELYYHPEFFGFLDDLVKAGKLRFYGVSVERVEEALKAIEYPNVQTVQIVYNIFRQRPAELLFKETQRRQVGVLARLPLSSGMLAGKMKRDSQFAPDDHRNFNRHGEAFDRGETFSGVPFEVGLDAVEELRALVPANMTMATFALRWILMNPAVTCVIPGGKRPAQVDENVIAGSLPPLSESTMARVQQIYDQRIRPHVHHYW